MFPLLAIESPFCSFASVSTTKVCPQCGDEYDDATGFCSKDGTPLVAQSEANLIGKMVGGRYKVIQQLGQPGRILQKEPSQHRLKSCGLSVPGRVTAAGSPASPVAAAPHPIELLVRE
jgi:predicted amidophosphoribosyltransferase